MILERDDLENNVALYLEEECYDMTLNYKIKSNLIVFWCSSAVDENTAAATLLNDFLLDISKEQKVYFYGYHLPDKDEQEIIDPAVILAKAEVLLEPTKTFYHLSEAKVKVERFDCAYEATIYYFKDEVEWSEFLATSVIARPKKLIANGILSAHFSTTNQGADVWFESNKNYEQRVLQLFKDLSDLGCEIKQPFHLSYPNANS